MTSNIQNNMNYREYLIKNADTIIKYNQIVANTNCSNIQVLPDNNLGDKSIKQLNQIHPSQNPISYNDNESLLKRNYLNDYYIMANMCSPTYSIKKI